MLITRLLQQNAVKFGDEEALVALNAKGFTPGDDVSYQAERKSLTWREFNAFANRTANFYAANGIKKGDRIGMILHNCIEWLPAWFGILKLGAVAVPLNYRRSAEGLLTQMERAQLSAAIVDTMSADRVRSVRDRLPSLRLIHSVCEKSAEPEGIPSFQEAVASAPDTDPGVKLRKRDMAAIYFSSGTTGEPKAVVYTHETLEEAVKREYANHGQVHEDVFICIPPLYHVGAKLHWSGNLITGAKGVVMAGFSVPAFLDVMQKEKVTIAFLLLPWVQDLLQAYDDGLWSMESRDLHAWRLMHMGAQPIPPPIVEELLEKLPQLSYDISYGLTESGGPGIMNLGHDNIRRSDTVGVPVPGWEARVIDAAGNDIAGEGVGELLVRGPGMMRGYYRNRKATAQALEGGWLHTGDIVRRYDDGFYAIIDRKKDIIITGGENVSPSEVENRIRMLPDVADTAVFGVPDPRLGEIIVAVISLRDNATLTQKEFVDYCRTFPYAAMPRHAFIGEVLRNATGKIDKKALREKYAPLCDASNEIRHKS